MMQSEADTSGLDSNLYLLNTNLEAMLRLLSRFGADGSLAQASPALIKMSIETTREEVRKLEVTLATLEPTADDTERDVRGTLLNLVARLTGMLDAHERALRDLDIEAQSLIPVPERP